MPNKNVPPNGNDEVEKHVKLKISERHPNGFTTRVSASVII
ncbi:MAG: hypothetical protein ABFS56_17255 [Pseudomonadota bacterium]